MVDLCPFICLPFAFNLPFIPFLGSFRLYFCPSRFRTVDSQRLMTVDIPAPVAFILAQSSLALSSFLPNSYLSAAVRCSTLPFTSVNINRYRCPMSCPFFFSIIRPRFADSSLRFVLSTSVLPPLLCPLSDAPAFFSDTPRGGVAKDDRGRVGRLRYYFGMHVRICAKIHRR